MEDKEAITFINKKLKENHSQRVIIIIFQATLIFFGFVSLIIFGINIVSITLLLVSIPIFFIILHEISPFEKSELLSIIQNNKDSIIWIFKKDTSVKLAPYFIPLFTYRHEYALIIATREKKVFQIPGTQEEINKLIKWFIKFLPKAIVGYNQELAYLYNQNTHKFIEKYVARTIKKI